MQAMRNLFHGVVLAAWGIAGILFSVKVLAADGPFLSGLVETGTWWLWFAGFAALTTGIVTKMSKAWGPFLVHSMAFLAVNAVPRVFPLSLLRFGLDALQR